MHEVKQRPACHRAEDLVTYLYGESTEADAVDFKNHLQHCDACRGEFEVFSHVHDSIATWRNEALGATFDPRAVSIEAAIESHQFIRRDRKLSALAAVREFFRLSPVWLRAATAFAAMLLFVGGITMVVRYSQKRVQVADNVRHEKMYTPEEMHAAVDEAIEKTRDEMSKQHPSNTVVQAEPGPRAKRQLAISNQVQTARRRDLTRHEREQLAADLRLTIPADEEEMQLALPDQERPN